MATYKVNTENTGLATDDKVRRFATIMQAGGHDVQFTRDWGYVNPGFNSDEDRTWSDGDWETALIQADDDTEN